MIVADRNPNTTGAQLLGLTGKESGAGLSAIVEGVRNGSIKSLLVLGEDATECGLTQADLARLDSLVVLHLHANTTTAHASVVLPGSGWAEKRGSMINIKGRLQRLNRAVQPPGAARDDWEILRDSDSSRQRHQWPRDDRGCLQPDGRAQSRPWPTLTSPKSATSESNSLCRRPPPKPWKFSTNFPGCSSSPPSPKRLSSSSASFCRWSLTPSMRSAASQRSFRIVSGQIGPAFRSLCSALKRISRRGSAALVSRWLML